MWYSNNVDQLCTLLKMRLHSRKNETETIPLRWGGRNSYFKWRTGDRTEIQLPLLIGTSYGGFCLVNKGLEFVFKVKTLADDIVDWEKESVWKSKERGKSIYTHITIPGRL